MKLFLDTADFKNIERWSKSDIINGVTTNPTLLSKEQGNPRDLIEKIAKVMGEKDVSVEVTEKEPEKVYKQAKKIAEIAKNIVVKIPCAQEYAWIIQKLVEEGVSINITLVFSLTQSLIMAKLGVKYISPFIGRLDDIDVDGMQLIYDCRLMLDTYGYETELLAASLRNRRHLNEVIIAGADIATIPLELVGSAFEHPLTDKGLESFITDWKKLGITQFP